MLVVAVDPGVTTGIAQWDTENEDKPRAWQVSIEEMHELLTKMRIEDFGDISFVSESFTIGMNTVKMSRQPASLELIGAMRWLCWEKSWPFELQSPASAKRFCENTRLRAAGWYVPGKDHANDALRHMFLWCVKRKIVRV